MDTVKQIDFEDTIARIGDIRHGNFSLYQDKILIYEIDRQKLAAEIDKKQMLAERMRSASMSLKIDAFCIIMVERGECAVNIDYRPFRVGENMAVVLSERHIIQFVSVSDDFKCCNSFIASDFLRNLLKDTLTSIPADISPFSVLSNPVTRLEKEEFILLMNNLERLRDNIRRTEHSFWQGMVQNELVNLIYEIRHILLLKHGRQPRNRKMSSREKVILRFFQLLIEHSRTEREVVFYADTLCVTSVYLSRLIKRTIGKPAIKIIHEMAISDAMTLLRKPDMTIQDAADAMNFPDRETFSKFFKKVAGVAPGEYVKRVNADSHDSVIDIGCNSKFHPYFYVF